MNNKKEILFFLGSIILVSVTIIMFCFLLHPDNMLKKNDVEKKTEEEYLAEEQAVNSQEPEGEWESDENLDSNAESGVTSGSPLPTLIPNHVNFSNIEVLSKNFSMEKIGEIEDKFRQYMDDAMFEDIGDVTIMEETVYYDGEDRYGMVIYLNDDLMTYVSLDYDGTRDKSYNISVTDYSEPPELIKEDEAYIKKKETEYEKLLEPDLYDNDVMNELSDIVEGYYSYIGNGDYYAGFEKYREGADYYYEKIDQFHYEYATYKKQNMRMMEQLAEGNSELIKNGKLNVKVEGYLDIEDTDYYLVKVKFILSYGKIKKTSSKWVTVFSYLEGDCIFPEDTTLMETWKYIYRY